MGRLVAFAVGVTVGLIARNTVPWGELKRVLFEGGTPGARAATRRLPGPGTATSPAEPAANSTASFTAHSSGRDYAAWSRDALYERARTLGIKGRSKMDKEALVEAVRQAELSNE